MAAKDKEWLSEERNRLIADYEWLRRMMRHLDMQTDMVDRQLTELENMLPDDYGPQEHPSRRPHRT